MCFVMVLTFMIFWAPLHFLNVYRFYDDSLSYAKYFGDLFFVCHLLAVSRSFVNPFIYAWTSRKFRSSFKYFICCYCLREKYKAMRFLQDDLVQKTNSFNIKFTGINNNNNNQNFSCNKSRTIYQCRNVNLTSNCLTAMQRKALLNQQNDFKSQENILKRKILTKSSI
jgi:hypothetical protein